MTTVGTISAVAPCLSGRECFPQHPPVLGVRREQVGLRESEGGHRVAQDVGTPHKRNPVVKDDGGRKPVEMVGAGKPQRVSDEPTLQAIDLILVN